MITTNGIAGLSLLLGSRCSGVTLFSAHVSGAALATVTTLATLSLVLPTFTTTYPSREFAPGQLLFAAVTSLGLYLLVVFTQTVRHRDFSLPVAQMGQWVVPEDDSHADPASTRSALTSLAVLFVTLVGLAEVESPAIGRVRSAVGFPQSLVGVIAALVLLPETIAAVRAARQGRIQTSRNLA